MDIWIIQDGEKTGPIHDFEIRRRIEKGELDADTPAWHEGLAAWQPLRSLPLFEHEFNKPAEVVETTFEPIPPRGGPPPLPMPAFIFRRFLARWFDLHLYSAIWWLALSLSGRDIKMLMGDPWLATLHYIPWFALEAFLIHRLATTPGKWLLDLSVRNPDGHCLNLAESIRRASRVMFFGIGLGWYLLSLICQVMAFVTTRKFGKSLWDQSGGHLVIGRSFHAAKLICFVLVFCTSFMLQLFVLLPHFLDQAEEANPQYKKEYQEIRERIYGKPKP
jgi:hypothetical protein